MNKKQDSGFSIIEVLIATLLFSIIILGFIYYQQAIITKHYAFYQRLLAERVAFQLLDSYPYIPQNLVPASWQYKINKMRYKNSCQLVLVTINLPNNQKSQQKRLICR